MTATADAEAVALQNARQQIESGKFDDVIETLRRLLMVDPDNREALYMLAVAQRYAGAYEPALTTLDHLKALAPGHARALQEEGHTYRAMNRESAALAAYARAIQLNPSLSASLRGQLEILESVGRVSEAVPVRARLNAVLSLPKPLATVTDLIAEGKLGQAETLCRRFLKQNPSHVEGMRLLADIAIRFGVLQDAEFLLESAKAFEPDNIAICIDYVGVLRKRQKFAAALHEAKALLGRDPDNPQFQSIFAIECMQNGDYGTALSVFDSVLDTRPDDPATLTAKGHALKTVGRFDDAVRVYRRAATVHPQHGEAHYALANLKTYTFAGPEIVQMLEQLERRDLGHMDRVHLCFALGKAHEDHDDYEAAFRFYARGNELKKAQSRYDADRMHEELAAQRDICTKALFERNDGVGHSAPDPIFIVGLPRAGSTLLEQILASHSLVDGTLELPNMLALAQTLRRRRGPRGTGRYPDVLAELPPEEFAEFGRAYIADTRIHREGAPFFIDKMPNNFRHIGLIKLMLPNAKIIDARRHPMACCFSGYKQLFAEGQEFSYALGDIGRYYRDYVELMDHWDAVLPGQVLRVMHEDVVDDLEEQVHRLLEFCGLPFEAACLRYHETERHVRTPSSEQVRRPIYRESVEQWRHFERWLEPLSLALDDILERYPIEPPPARTGRLT